MKNHHGYSTYIGVSDVFGISTELFFNFFLHILKEHQKWIQKQVSKSWGNENFYFL